eukprot:CAMPEP_0202687368 /NCGR_PEP_ID=MMETSP1385-20130828/3059_1 /ASSEMBLY_ACC=CAM_ASM_000861 /TAXON_ID=933848 /ORGANISM="Elphidium margaritaceum" /LENGTH=688 /DNA_ID=CAMNT_0049342149 /DNA_START=102 /DNA_END=2168 /DNA_ORIENTATION=-
MLWILASLCVINGIVNAGGQQNQNGDENNGCDYVFRNSDFYAGTVRIRRSGRYCLGEDIVFNPKQGNIASPNRYGAWFPTDAKAYPGCDTHDDGSFALGFFAAIAIETSNVELDLKGYELRAGRRFYIQQRFFNLIEIQNAPFDFGEGPANFGQTVQRIRNVYIKNGRLGLTSHNGIHAFNVDNVGVYDLQVYDFEVAGIQFNGFNDVEIRNVDIGPSASDVPFWGYYSHGRFSLNGLSLIDRKDQKYVRFQGGRQLTLQQIYENLRDSLDIAFRAELGKTTDNDKSHKLYDLSLDMYKNPYRLPDGSTLYGMIFNSKGLAVQGFGDSDNEHREHGNKLYLENVNVDGLRLSVNEIPTLYFDRCDGYYRNEDGSTSITPVLGRFGDVFDVRRALRTQDWSHVDRGFGERNSGYSYDDIKYYGNPLSDAQIALGIFSAPFTSNWGLQAEADSSRGKEAFYRWATDSKSDGLPKCARFACNADSMFHLNKGVIGIRLDGIENVVVRNVKVKELSNESPLGSSACGSYDGPFDGGQPSGLRREGYMGADVRGISIINGGTTEFYGQCSVESVRSWYGDVIGVHLMDNAAIYLDEADDGMKFNDLECATSVSSALYGQLRDSGLSPYPNNFYDCNIKAEQLKDRRFESYPYDYTKGNIDHSGLGYIYPKDAIQGECKEVYFDDDGVKRRRFF